ncbi:phosphatase PAP2 family protein [Rhodococcus sp. 1R11]|uniref:phosphatase PAP2 family protein n=1 Tax=Rhodococcus sp. 1R11 TaxID=2559614 RepID=UPI0014314F0A|nr:phosphatase PAP2 family protein [Rhodococcus sp. 1R11]
MTQVQQTLTVADEPLSAVLQELLGTLIAVLLSSSMSAVHATATEVFTEAATADVEIAGMVIAVGLLGAGTMFRVRSDRAAATIFGALGFAFAVVVLAVAVHSNGWLTRSDAPVAAWFVDHRTRALDELALAVTTAGGPAETAALGLVVAVLLVWRTKRYGPALVMLATVGSASMLCTIVKLIVGRERPPQSIQLMLETDFSFPSGHVTGTAALSLMLALIAGIHRSRGVRALFLGIALAVTVAVACTRMYLGVHWLTDVLAGALLAACAVTLGSYVLHRLDSGGDATDATPPRLLMNRISL